MTATRTHAPVDQFSSRRAQSAELTRTLRTLRRATPLMRRLAGGAHLGVVSAIAALLAYVPTHLLGLRQGFWSAITAIAVVQTEFRATQSTAREQFLGAAVGGVVALVVFLALGQHLFVYALAVVVAMLACWGFNIESSSRLAGITATIILLVPHVGSPAQMFTSRLLEVGWGVCVSVMTVWLAARLPAARLLRLAESSPRPRGRPPR